MRTRTREAERRRCVRMRPLAFVGALLAAPLGTASGKWEQAFGYDEAGGWAELPAETGCCPPVKGMKRVSAG
jgi:hypothetical protein